MDSDSPADLSGLDSLPILCSSKDVFVKTLRSLRNRPVHQQSLLLTYSDAVSRCAHSLMTEVFDEHLRYT